MDRKKYFSMVCRNPYWARERTGSVRGVTKTRVLYYPGVSTCTGINTDTACVRKVMRRRCVLATAPYFCQWPPL